MQPKLIAFHLPQFHPIPENDRWWGKGFTEWTNVTRAKPLFPGHHQPQLPADLGFYDLRLPEARQAQAELAREYGIHGFCYYHYWFNGKRLLERPIEDILKSGEPDFPFCLCWANENWTRRWDGAEQEILISQNYSDDDDLAHIQYLLPFLKDPRYICIDGKPLVLIYRAKHLPNPQRTLQIWRNEARKAGLDGLFVCRVENFFNERDDPHALGFDASVDFQPDWMAVTTDTPSLTLENGHFVVDYRDLVERELNRAPVEHLRFPGITPAWDNSARRKKNAFITANSSPEAYEYWLVEILKELRTRPDRPQLVFVNAWNEWAEGNHLEPDQKFGRSYLEATRRALQSYAQGSHLKPAPLLDVARLGTHVYQQHYIAWLQQHALSKSQATLHDQRLAQQTPAAVQIFIDACVGDIELLPHTLNSISQQLYEHWQVELLSPQPAPANLNAGRLKWHTISPDQVLSSIAELAGRDQHAWVCVLQAGDVLKQDALLFAMQHLHEARETRLLLTDGDTRTSDGLPISTWFAPGFNIDWLRSSLHIGGLVLTSPELAQQAATDVAGLNSLALPLAATLRAIEQGCGDHIARIALHRHAGDTIIPLDIRAAVLQAHLTRQSQTTATLEHGLADNSCRIRYGQDFSTTTVDVLITHLTTADELLRSVQGVLEHCAGLAVNVLIPRTRDLAPSTLSCLEQLAQLNTQRVQIVDLARGQTQNCLALLAEHSTCDFVLSLRCGLVPLDEEWLSALLNHGLRDQVGVVGGRVVAPDGTLTGGMIKLRDHGYKVIYGQGLAATTLGNNNELQLEQNCIAVCGQFALVRRTLLNHMEASESGEHDFKALCLRLHELGYLTVWTPHALMTQPQAAAPRHTRAPLNADLSFLQAWLKRLPRDPYANPLLNGEAARPKLQLDIAQAFDPLPWHPIPRVYAHPADLGGSSEIRIVTPLKALAQANHIQGSASTTFLPPWNLAQLAPDTIVTQRVFSDNGLAWLKSYQLYDKALLVYELDDLISSMPADNGQRHGFPADVHERIVRGIQLCHRLVVSTEPLAKFYGRYADQTIVAPNLLDERTWGTRSAQPNTGARIRIGWAGSANRVGDLMLLHEVIRATANEMDWVFMGYCPDALRPLVKEFHPGVAVRDYPEALAALRLDIAVAPLVANPFNEAKSNLKLLEYGALGYPVICSNLLPYQGTLPVVRVSNTAQHWLRAIRELANDFEQRQALGQNLQQAVRSEWMIQSKLDTWKRAWLRN